MDALAAFAYAHIAVHEVLDLDARALAEQAEFGERHLTADDDARDAILFEFFNGVLVVRIHHDRCVNGDVDTHLMYELEDRKVLYEQSVRLDFVEVGKVLAQRRNFFVADEVVERDVEFDIVLVRVSDGFLEHLVIEVEIALVHAHIKVLAAEVAGVGTRFNTSYECIPSACWCQKFNRFTIQNHNR